LEEIKGLREDIQPGYAKQMQTDIRAIKERLGIAVSLPPSQEKSKKKG